MGDSWQEYVEYNIRDHQDHKTPDEIHAKSERLRDTFEVTSSLSITALSISPSTPDVKRSFLTGFIIKRAVLAVRP